MDFNLLGSKIVSRLGNDSSEGGKPQQQYGVRVRAPGKRDVVTELVCGPGTQQQLMKLEDILPHKEETP